MSDRSSGIEFTAPILQVDGMNAAYVEFPFLVQELFGTRGQVKVKAVFDGKVEYRGSLANMGRGCHSLGLTKDIRLQLGKTFGDEVTVWLERDTDIREVVVPDDVCAVLDQYPEEKAYFDRLAYTHRKEYIGWISSAKKEETRQRRLTTFIQMLQDKKKPDQK